VNGREGRDGCAVRRANFGHTRVRHHGGLEKLAERIEGVARHAKKGGGLMDPVFAELSRNFYTPFSWAALVVGFLAGLLGVLFGRRR
jgi:hypothetical protein